MQKLTCYMVMTWDDMEPGETRLHMVQSSLEGGLFQRLVLYSRASGNVRVLGTAEVKVVGDSLPPMFCLIGKFVDPPAFSGTGAEEHWCLFADESEARALHAEWKADPRYAIGVAQGKEPAPKTPGPHKMLCETYYRNQVDSFLHKVENLWGIRLTGPKPGDRQRKGAKRNG